MKKLSAAEKKQLGALEDLVRRRLDTFVEVGQALLRIKLLCDMSTAEFESYCMSKWGFSGRRGRQLVAAAKLAENLGTIVPNEAQARALGKAPAELQGPVLCAATAEGPTNAERIDQLLQKALGTSDPVRFLQESAEQARQKAAERRGPPVDVVDAALASIDRFCDRAGALLKQAQKQHAKLADVAEWGDEKVQEILASIEEYRFGCRRTGERQTDEIQERKAA